MGRRQRLGIAVVLIVLAAAPAAGEARATAPIVNGLATSAFPSVGLLLNPPAGTCTGTLIGCSDFLTAAHCICGVGLSGEECRARTDLADPSRQRVFFQHAGFFDVAAVEVHPGYRFGTTSDLAVLRLAAPVSGIRPSPLHRAGRPPAGTPGVIAGFGSVPELALPSGLKRTGRVTLETCTLPGLDAGRHLCWRFAAPLGAPGEDSSTCNGDSGGPLFVHQGERLALAGVTSGGFYCSPPDHPFDAAIDADLDWITAVAGPLGDGACGSRVAPVGEGGTAVQASTGELAGGAELRYDLEVPPGAPELRVAVNAPAALGHGLELRLRHGSPPTAAAADCRAGGRGTFAHCRVADPAPGTWHVLVAPSHPGGTVVQTTATVFAPAGPATGCNAGADAVVLHGGRFRVDACWRTADGKSGTGRLAHQEGHGATLWFFHRDNPELFLKVIDACGPPFDAFWVFLAGLTNVEVEVQVTDTASGVSQRYTSPQGSPFAPVQDTATFTTCR
jgi:hypothetical protein